MAMARVALRRNFARQRAPRYPLGIEIQYVSILRTIPQAFRKAAMAEITKTLPRIFAEIKQYRGDSDLNAEIRLDANWSLIFFTMIQLISDLVGLNLNRALDSVANISKQINATNNADWQRQIRSAYGVNILVSEPQLPDLLNVWERQNLDLIKSIPVQMVDRLRGEMLKGFTEGKGLRDMTRMVQEAADVGDRRAELIARDQVGKLNGQLTEMRQRSIGVDGYVWRTSQDERVRPTHRVRNGKKYLWNDKGIKPGSEIRCRCIAEPVFPEEFGTDQTKVRRIIK